MPGTLESTQSECDGLDEASPGRLGLLALFPAEAPRFYDIWERALVGRAPECQIALDASGLSRKHLRIRLEGERLLAEDLGSRNGSYCDGRMFTSAALEHGSVLRLGEAVFMVWRARALASFAFSELSPGLFGGVTLAGRLSRLKTIASSDLAVIVAGPSGCGKERVAQSLHVESGRAGAFVAVNCATIPETLAESQLFGHRKGSFTGAERSQVGYVAAADNGTLFLDEAVELPLPVQAKLLRVLQEREYVPVGETRPLPIDVRVIASAQQPLEEAVRQSRFREDLYARLNGFELRLPTLAERREDVPFLFRRFLEREFQGHPPKLTARLVEALCIDPWPLNVRELETAARRASILHRDKSELALRDVFPELSGGPASGGAPPRRSEPPASDLDEPDLALLVQALTDHKGNVRRAAIQAGLSRARVYRLIESRSIDLERFRRGAPTSD